MRFSPQILDEIRARLPVSSVVGRKVRLKKAGREWKGLSPFNAEKTPSFYVNDQKGFYHCFSSGKHGDIFSFLTETEGLSFPEAVERLAAEAGVSLPKASPEQAREAEERRDVIDVLEIAARFYEGQLKRESGAQARAYLDKRGVSGATRAEFRIGYAPAGRTVLLDYLREQGIANDLILRAGLAIEPEDGRGLYDRFRDRVVFPIQDLKARVVAFGGRAMSDEVKPKYLNSPETELFHKGRIVFNGHRAREAAHRTQSLAVVEGYLDAIAAYQAGHKAVVATLGTAFTEEQIETLWRFAPEPVVCFDGDRAGQAAAFRALDRMLPILKVGKSFRFAFLPEGQDPDDLIRATGPEAFGEVVVNALKFWEVLWNRESAGIDPKDPDSVARLQQSLHELVSQMADPQLRYRYELSAKIHIRDLVWQSGRPALKVVAGDASVPSLLRASHILAGEATRLTGIEQLFLGLCVEYPDFAHAVCDRISRINFRGGYKADNSDMRHQAFSNALMDLLLEEDVHDTGAVHSRINPAFYDALDYLHGRQGEGRPMGYRLRQRLPALGYVHDEAYFGRLFWHFLDMLELREMEDHLAEMVAHIDQAIDESEGEQLLHLQAAVLEWRDRIHQQENDLAEEASAYRPRAKAA